jgi:adenylate cyclase
MKSLSKFFGVRRTVGLLLVPLLVLLRVWDPAPLETLRLKTFDYYQVLKPRSAQIRPVVIVDIDEESLSKLGQWPWPRTLIADLVSRLTKLGAVVIAFDVLFPEPDRMSPSVAAQSFKELDEETRARLEKLPSNDAVLASAIKQSRVVLGQSGSLTLNSGLSRQGNRPQTGVAALGGDPSPNVVTFPGLLTNVPPLEQAAAGRGLITMRSERDGTVRRVPLVMKAQGALVPALSLEMLRVATNAGAVIVRSDQAGVRAVAVPGLEIPTDRNGQFWVYFSPHDPARFLSAATILDGTADPARVAGKLVLIGTSAIGLLDVRTTPLDAVVPGVEIHAQVLEAALTQVLLSRPSYSNLVEVLGTVLFGALIIIFAPTVGALALLLLGIGVAAVLVAASWLMFTQAGTLIDVTYPLLSTFAIYLVMVFISYFREQKERRRIRSAFRQYLSPALVEQLAQSPEKLMLGGEQRDMTILFSDVRGFTTISESYKHDPQGLTSLMNRFLTPLTNAIIDNKGTIDKYMGDAIMAFWNAPLDDKRHEENACRAALEMLRRVEALNRERQEEAQRSGGAFIPIKIGVGLNTGNCVVGNMGSDLRFDYSVLGDSVNLASRLEGQSKTYGVPIIIGSKTAEAVADKFASLEIDLITVKGKTEPEHVYTVLGGDDVAHGGDYGRLRDLNAAMLDCFRRRDWDGARAAMAQCRDLSNGFGLDEVYDLYSERIEMFLKNPPPDDWDGVVALQTK